MLGVFDFHLDLLMNELLNLNPYFCHYQSPESTFFMISQISWDERDRVTVLLWLLSRFLFISRLPPLLIITCTLSWVRLLTLSFYCYYQSLLIALKKCWDRFNMGCYVAIFTLQCGTGFHATSEPSFAVVK